MVYYVVTEFGILYHMCGSWTLNSVSGRISGLPEIRPTGYEGPGNSMFYYRSTEIRIFTESIFEGTIKDEKKTIKNVPTACPL